MLTNATFYQKYSNNSNIVKYYCN